MGFSCQMRLLGPRQVWASTLWIEGTLIISSHMLNKTKAKRARPTRTFPDRGHDYVASTSTPKKLTRLKRSDSPSAKRGPRIASAVRQCPPTGERLKSPSRYARRGSAAGHGWRQAAQEDD